MQRLPLAALALPALRHRPRSLMATFMVVLRALIDAGGHATLDEHCLATLVRVQVMDALNPVAAQVIGRTRLVEPVRELKDLLAVIAHRDHDDARMRPPCMRLRRRNRSRSISPRSGRVRSIGRCRGWICSLWPARNRSCAR